VKEEIMLNLPQAIAAYFEAVGGEDGDALVAPFAANAVVSDEAAKHEGHAAIRTWWAEAKAKYHQTTTPLETFADGEAIVVRCKVAGDFPNSPIELDFHFTLAGDRIAKLEIH
jgi:ketosteroid isomerase-like protein